MICPKCKAEYRSGFTTCADCEVMLVTHLPQRAMSGAMMGARQDSEADLDSGGDAHAGEANDSEVGEESEAAEPGDPNRDPFCSFWKGTDLRVCTEICTVLDEAGIPHKTIRRQDHLFNFNNQSPYEVGVPASVYEKAELAIKDAFGTEEETGEEAVRLLTAPERESADDFDERVAGHERAEERSEANEWLGPRYPEDATVEVWSGEDVGLREMIEISLKENDVLTRSEEETGGARVFVLPGDEKRAKEIVREIVDAAPLGSEEGGS